MDFTNEELKLLKYIFSEKSEALRRSYQDFDNRIRELSEETGLPETELRDSGIEILPDFWETMDKMVKDPNVFETLPEEHATWVLQVLIVEGEAQELDIDSVEDKLMRYFFIKFSNQN